MVARFFLCVFAAVGLLMPAIAAAAELQPVDAVLGRLGKSAAPAQSGLSEPAKLLADITQFRAKAASVEGEPAAKEWLALWDRAIALVPSRVVGDYSAFDIEVGGPVGPSSVISALPQPSVWPALRKHAIARAKSKPADTSALGLRLVTEMLTADKGAVFKSVVEFERIASAASPSEREMKVFSVNRARSIIYKLYGSREQIAEGFVAGVATQSGQDDFGLPLEVPDLVGLVGEKRAEDLLRQVLQKPVSLRVPEGEATRRLARKLAVSEISTLRKAQWGLVDTVGTAAVYEAMRKRFDPVSGETKAAPGEASGAGFDYTRQQADVYYFLDLIIAGRYDDAERMMTRIGSSREGLIIPRDAMNALIRNGKNQPVYEFLGKVLQKRPQLQGWEAYIEQAAYLGRAKDAIALIDTILSRSDLPQYLRADLSRRRLDALLGADQVDAALAGFQGLLSSPPSKDDPKLGERTDAAIRIATLGRILKQPNLSAAGFDFAQKALAFPPSQRDYRRQERVTGLLAELRRQDRVAEAQTIALREIDTASSDRSNAGFAAFTVTPGQRAALTEIAGIYDSAGRTADVLRLLNEVRTWGARDLLAIASEKDSLGTPLGLMAARAFKASGNINAARATVRVVIEQFPAHDPAYLALVDLNGSQAVAELDRLYALDQFEERPLIWKAFALKGTGKLAEAEIEIRRAISIDPSDGEQGKNDRMRAYATLADILEAKGDANNAKLYRRAVAAIRISENADELHKVGLYQRAFAQYRAALAEFSDAYCIQSRLAVQLSKQGFHDEALKHYRRAYELMPDSFGRVESHCFGCENVFGDNNAQTAAEQIFTDLIKKEPNKPQSHYMLGYLRKEQGRYEEALALFRRSVQLDAQYLNAWRHLHELGTKTYMEAWERDNARMKLFALDPRRRHVRYDLNEVVDIGSLWPALQRAGANPDLNPSFSQVYPLAGSAKEQDETLVKLPAELRAQFRRFSELQDRATRSPQKLGTSAFAKHSLFASVLVMMGYSGREFID
jgi:tetratricopeptide (TPR) repeat protein